jgi:hypothetical protein
MPQAVAWALERGGRFVAAHADALACERLAVLLYAAAPDRLTSRLEDWRCADGGFTPMREPQPLRPRRGTAAGALEALGILDECGVRSGALLEGVVAWLGRVQEDDGAWRAEDPRDAALGDPIYLTGMLAGHLSKLSCGSPGTLARAEAFLSAGFSPERVEADDWRGLMAYAHVCMNGATELADEALQWCGRALEKGFRSGGIDALAAARILLLCDAPSLPGGRLSGAEVLLALLPLQASDGAFGSLAAAPADRVEATLIGLRALLRFGAKGSAWTPA